MQPQDNALIGSAGEHYVLYQLLRRNMLAALAPRNAYAADIVVFSPSMSVGSMVQVKTRTSRQGIGWLMQAKHEGLIHPRLFYAFVDLEPSEPVVHVMPSAVAADVVRRQHQAWLAIPGKDGRVHQDSPARRLAPRFSHQVPDLAPDWLDAYRDRWDLITADADITTTQEVLVPEVHP